MLCNQPLKPPNNTQLIRKSKILSKVNQYTNYWEMKVISSQVKMKVYKIQVYWVVLRNLLIIRKMRAVSYLISIRKINWIDLQ